MRHQLSETFIAGKQPIQRLEIGELRGLQRLASVLADECPEPFAQIPCLRGDAVDFPRLRLFAHRIEHVRRHKMRLLQPRQQPLAIADPVNFGIDRGRDRVQKIQPRRIGDEYGGGFLRP